MSPCVMTKLCLRSVSQCYDWTVFKQCLPVLWLNCVQAVSACVMTELCSGNFYLCYDWAVLIIIIIIMEICKAPTLQLKALNKHTHIMYIEMDNVIPPKKCIYRQVFKNNYAKDAHTYTRTRTRTHTHTPTHTHTHTHTHCTDWWEWRTMWFNWNILRREMSWVDFWRKRE